ncbi:MAG: DUF1343 domain-containing protein [Bacteroidales bacterium]|nr:DUF1343 domain-containing protein [Bacteroidales bacterium]MCF8458599.1 DUF1343 domain-containing protein [Bacteroidales bacterium]
MFKLIHQSAILVLLLLFTSGQKLNAQENHVITGTQQTQLYLPMLKGKKVAIVANPTSRIGKQHLVDSLLKMNVDLIKIFSPEHGFRGDAEAGEQVGSFVDEKTGIPVISIYGDHKKPTPDDLKNVGILIFDLQDVGARFYTYISSLHYLMEACAENNIPVIVLDRPNPNGFYVDGPVLKKGFESFVGMHPVPVVHGMTIGEYAQMINGEGWLKDKIKSKLTVITCQNYDHNTLYELPVKPSPNLPNMVSVYLYPSLCFFEGTIMSVGRGTDYPFQCYGHPDFVLGSYIFTPKSIPGVSLHPKYEGENCFGANLSFTSELVVAQKQIYLGWLIGTWQELHLKKNYFIPFFDKLAGSDLLRKQIEAGKNEEEIRQSWQEDLLKFKETRKKYLLYADFE